MLIKWIIPCFPSGCKFIHARAEGYRKLHLINGEARRLLFWESSIPFWEDELSKQGFKQQFTTISVMARIFDTHCQKEPAMLTLQNFRVMPFEKKCDVITFTGNYLAQRTLADCKVFLYFTEGFFIEVFYSSKYQKVLMINAFEKAIGLDPYLDKISLGDLVTI